MAIRMRRGNEADFDPSKMLPGEWAVSTDTKYVRMCFSPGIVLRMATYEAFESDMAEIRKIFSECQSIQTAIELIQKNVTNSELVIENYVKEAKQYRDEAEQFRNEASMFAPEGYEDLVKNVSDNTVKIDTIIEKAELNIKNNAKGSNIHLTDSADSNVVALELYGKTEQNAYTGKNFLSMAKTNVTKNGLDFTVDIENQSFSIIGTTTANTGIDISDNIDEIRERIDKGGTFVFSLVNAVYDVTDCNICIYCEVDGVNKYLMANGKPLTLPSGTYVRSANLYVPSGTTVNLSNVKIQLEEGNVATEWEPYVGGTPSPNPSYPQEIKSVKGKNLLDCRGLVETTTNGVKFTPVYDENDNLLYINVNGTASANAIFELRTEPIDKTDAYILSGCPSSGSSTSYRMTYTEWDASWNWLTTSIDTGNGVLLTHNDNVGNASFKIEIYGGTVCDNLKFYPMLRSASITDDTYVPYGLLRIKTHGKNLLDLEAVTKNSTFDASGLINTSSVSSITDFILVSGKENVTISNAINDTFTRIACYYDVNKSFISSEEYSSKKHTFTVPSNAYYMRIAVGVNIENIQLEIGVEATEYQPYQSSEITLSEPIELNGFNGVYDVVTSDGVTRRFAEIRVLSSFDWSTSGGDAGADGHCFQTRMYSELFAKNTNEYVLTNALCTHFIIKKSGDLYFKSSDEIGDGIAIFQNTNGYNVIRCRNTDCSSLADFKTWLDENEVYLVYELATPTTEALQIDFTALKTFYPETHVSNNADCDMSITYTADAKNYIDNKIALLTTAIYNNI